MSVANVGRSWKRLRTFIRRLATVPSFDITEAKINQLPKLTFAGKCRVINTPLDEDKYQNEINDIKNAAIVGFDTESSMFSNKHTDPCLIQLSTPNTALLWRLKRRNKDRGFTIWLSPTLIDILTSTSILKVGHAICENDAVSMLKNYYLDMKNFHDTLVLARELAIHPPSLRRLVAVFLGQSLCKKQRLSNWEKRVLLDEQVSYACADAWASLKVYEFMIRLATDNDCTFHQPLERAWNLLKPGDQEVILKKVTQDELNRSVNRSIYFHSVQGSVYYNNSKAETMSSKVCKRPVYKNGATGQDSNLELRKDNMLFIM